MVITYHKGILEPHLHCDPKMHAVANATAATAAILLASAHDAAPDATAAGHIRAQAAAAATPTPLAANAAAAAAAAACRAAADA